VGDVIPAGNRGRDEEGLEGGGRQVLWALIGYVLRPKFEDWWLLAYLVQSWYFLPGLHNGKAPTNKHR
jgi:hypothetical protein